MSGKADGLPPDFPKYLSCECAKKRKGVWGGELPGGHFWGNILGTHEKAAVEGEKRFCLAAGPK